MFRPERTCKQQSNSFLHSKKNIYKYFLNKSLMFFRRFKKILVQLRNWVPTEFIFKKVGKTDLYSGYHFWLSHCNLYRALLKILKDLDNEFKKRNTIRRIRRSNSFLLELTTTITLISCTPFWYFDGDHLHVWRLSMTSVWGHRITSST